MLIGNTFTGSAIRTLDDFGAAPEHYVPRTYSGSDVVQGKKNPYAVLLDPENTPFQTDKPSALPIKRLWTYLIHQDYLQETFVRFMFKRRRTDLPSLDTIAELSAVDDSPKMSRDAIRIVHKDQDIVTAFAVNRANPRMIVLSTAKDITEINISSLLHPEEWLQDEGEFGLVTMKNQVMPSVRIRAPVGLFSRLIDWLFDCFMIDWLIDWLIGWLSDRLIDLIGWLIDWSTASGIFICLVEWYDGFPSRPRWTRPIRNS